MKYSLLHLHFIFGFIPLVQAVAFPGQTPPPVSPNQKVFAAPDFTRPKCKHGQDIANEKRAFGHDIVTCAIIPLEEAQKLSPTAGITTPIPVGCTSGICGFSGNYVGCIHYSTQAIISKCIDYTSGAFPCGTRGDGCGDATYVCNAYSSKCQPYIYRGTLTAYGCETAVAGPISVQAVSLTPFTPVTGSTATQTQPPTSKTSESLQDRLNLPFSIGTLAGIAAGGIILLIALCCLGCCCLRRRRTHAQAYDMNMPQAYQQPQTQQYPQYQPPQSPTQTYYPTAQSPGPQTQYPPQYGSQQTTYGYQPPKYPYQTTEMPAR